MQKMMKNLDTKDNTDVTEALSGNASSKINANVESPPKDVTKRTSATSIISVLAVICVLLLIAIGTVLYGGKSNAPVSAPSQQRGELPVPSSKSMHSPQSMMQNRDQENAATPMDMEHMPCHSMGNGKWMGDCQYDEQGNILK